MDSENKIDWLAGPISSSFTLADIQRVRGCFNKHGNDYVSEVWSSIEKNLCKWMMENREHVQGNSLSDADNNPVFNIIKTNNEQHLTCSDFIFILASTEHYLPVVETIQKYSFKHVMASVCLYYMVMNQEKEALRALYWLDKKLINKHRKGKQYAAKRSHGIDEEAKEFARNLASSTWNEQIEDGDNIMDKGEMLVYVSGTLITSNYKGRSSKKHGYSEETIWKWINDLAPYEVRKGGRRAKK